METIIRTNGATLIFLPQRRRAPPRAQPAAIRMPSSRLARLYAGFGTGSITVALTLAGCIVSIALYLCFGVALDLWGAPL